MRLFDAAITLAVSLPFTLLDNPETISGWKAHACFLGLLLVPIAGVALLCLAGYFILYAEVVK